MSAARGRPSRDPADAALTAAAAKLRPLAHPARLRLLRALAGGERSASELTDRAAVPSGSLAGHLAALRVAGLVSARRDGRRVCYRLDRAGWLAARVALRDLASLADEP